jgi:hypothetical protein
VRSGSAKKIALALCPVLVLGFAACDTTQDKAARLAVRSDRQSDRKPIQVHRVDHQVKVVRASLVRGSGGAAVAVTLRNTGSTPVNDLPILVGVKTAAGSDQPLNGDGHLPYFQAHAPAIAPGQEATWVFTTEDDLASARSAYAKVGVDTDSDSTGGDTVQATVSNDTGLPQYDLAVYAWADRDGHLVAAGHAQISDLNAGDASTVKVALIGDAKGADVHVAAPPTIFQ